MTFRFIFLWLFFLPFFLLCTDQLLGQAGRLELLGNVMQQGKGVEGVKINSMRGDGKSEQVFSSIGGKFFVQLELGSDYTLVFSRVGGATKAILIDTRVPKSELEQIFSFKFKIDLDHIPKGQSFTNEDTLRIAKIYYSDVYADFNYDPKFERP